MIGVQNQSYEGASMSKFPKNLKIDPPFELVVNSLRVAIFPLQIGIRLCCLKNKAT